MENKPFFLVPCIWVYRMVKIPFRFLKYFSLGLFIVLYMITNMLTYLISRPIRYVIYGFIVICDIIYQILNMITIRIPVYAFVGVAFVLFMIKSGFARLGKSMYNLFVNAFDKIYVLFKKPKKEKKVSPKKAAKLAQKNELKQQRLEKKKKQREKNEFINDKVTIEKKTFGQKIASFFKSIANSPKTFATAIKRRYNNSTVVRYIQNKKTLDSEALLINFDSEDADKSETKLLYEYVAKDPDGKVVKGYFEAYSKVEVHSFLLSEGLTVYSIRTNQWITFLHKNEASTKKRIKNKDLIFFLTQLSTYLKAGITLVESLKILSRQYKNKTYQRIFRTLVYDLTMGDNFSEALEKQGETFPRLLINMVKTSEMTGELPEVLDDMADHFSKIEKTKKEMINALMYPCLVFVFAIGVIVFIMLFVIPKFVDIYASMDADAIPEFTLFIMSVSNFLQHNIIWIIIGTIILVIIMVIMYKKIRAFRMGMQWFAMHLPAFGNVIIYNEVTMFTKTLSSLLKHNVFITQSMDILNKMTNNEIYKALILNTITNLGKGDKISDAFKGQWAFPVPAYEMLVTGEKTGELPEMMEKVANYYQTLQESSVARIKTFIEPILIVFLTGMVGTIVLAIIIPMFNMYSAIQ